MATIYKENVFEGKHFKGKALETLNSKGSFPTEDYVLACPLMAVSIVQAVPSLDRASCVGGHLERPRTTGRSFLPTAAAWRLSPPPPPPVLPGTTPHPRMVPAVGRMKRRADLHADASCPTASPSPIPPPLLEPRASALPRVSVLLTHPPSSSLLYSVRSWD